ncbi:MAG: hypothetical protein ACRDTH_01255 [Pseudonocardiaceae bacterium]
MPALPTPTDVRRMREQAEAGVTITFDALKAPLFAVLGAVDAAGQTELRKLAGVCDKAVRQAYASLVERGEAVFDDLRSQPRVKQALDSVESSVDTAQQRLEGVVGDLNAAAAELRSRFARTSRSVGEQAAPTPSSPAAPPRRPASGPADNNKSRS